MSYKRKNTSSPECENSPKRQCITDHSTYDEDAISDTSANDYDERPQISNTTGQSGAFPGLAEGRDGELFYGPADNGIDYLRMVRSEARGIPSLLKASTEDHYSNQKYGQGGDEVHEDDYAGGYWEDDAFIATPFIANTRNADPMPVAQKKYYQSIAALYDLNRARLRRTPPIESISRLKSSQPISFPSANARAQDVWFEALCNSDPNPVQVACMDDDSVMEFLRLVGDKLRDLLSVDCTGDSDKTRRIGAWLWAALAKCPGRDVLGADEICDLRELAKVAAEMIQTMNSTPFLETATDVTDKGGQMGKQRGQASADEDLTLSIDAARSRLRQSHQDGGTLNGVDLANTDTECGPKTFSENQKPTHDPTASLKIVILDIILTIIGETYGQRDLLEHRPLWSDDKLQLAKTVCSA